MFKIIRTLLQGASARAEDQIVDAFAIDLIEQKIREADAGLAAAKQTLATLIVRQRNEQQALDRIEVRLADLEGRAREALAAGREELAADAAGVMAELENERTVRRETLAQLSARILRTRSAVEKAHRRIIDLRQRLISARAVDAERQAQKRLNRSLGATAAAREAEELIARVMNQPEPLEESQVLDEIDAALDGSLVRDRLAAAGFGAKVKVDAGDVLARLRSSAAATSPAA